MKTPLNPTARHLLIGTGSLLLLSLILGALTFLSMSGCSHSSASTPPAMSETRLEIPVLKPRKDGLGSFEERAHVAQIYDENKALISRNQDDAKAWLALSELFMNEARITGEHPYYYPAALQMLEAIPHLSTQPSDIRFQAAYYKSSVLMSMHAFSQALTAAEEGRQLFPQNAGIHGVLVDANVELGHYEEAVRLSDIMVGLRPDLRSYSRISYLREIHGDPAGAMEAMQLAVDAGMPGYEQTAWCRLMLGDLCARYGKTEEARMHYTLLLEERPEYPFAYAGLASAALTKQDYATALDYTEKAIALIPEVSFYELKAEILAQSGRKEEAEKLVPEILKMMQEDQASGHQVDLELAQVQLHLAHDTKAAGESARKAYAARPENIDVNTLMADIAYTEGDYAQAQRYMDVAMRTQSQDPARLCLAGLIAVRNSNPTAGKRLIRLAFSQNPHLVSPHAAAAKALL